MVMGTITAYAAIARFPLNIAIQTLLCQLLGEVTWTLFGSALRPVPKIGPAVRAFDACGALASGLALSGLPGRMNRPRPMREQGFQ